MSDFLTISYRSVDGSYFPIVISDEAMTGQGMEKTVGARFNKPHIGIRRNGIFQRFWDELDMVQTRNKLILLQKEKNTIPSYVKNVQRHFELAVTAISEIPNNPTAEELFISYKNVCDEYRNICIYAYVANLLDRPLAAAAKNGLAELISNSDEATRNNYLLKLTRNPVANFLYDHDLELIQLLLAPNNETDITNHIEKWKTLFNGGNDSYGAQDVKDRILAFRGLSQEDLLKKKQQINNEYDLAKSEINQVEAELNIPNGLKATLALLRDCILLKETRKFCMTRLEDLVVPLFTSIGEKIGIKTENVAYLLSDEIERALLHCDQRMTNDYIESFKNNLCYVIQDGETRRFIGPKVDEVIDKYRLSDEIMPAATITKKQTPTQNTTDFKGFVSCLGYAKGPVKIVLGKSDFSKVQPGDILITPITTPEYIAIFDKIKGMVTFDGAGLTSHPATLSREYKIPAILGVKELDGVLHDNDIIEVDANNNKVKIIRSARQ